MKTVNFTVCRVQESTQRWQHFIKYQPTTFYSNRSNWLNDLVKILQHKIHIIGRMEKNKAILKYHKITIFICRADNFQHKNS